MRKPKPSKATQAYAKYIAMVVRNELENFHSENLSDAQMKELNPLIVSVVRRNEGNDASVQRDLYCS